MWAYYARQNSDVVCCEKNNMDAHQGSYALSRAPRQYSRIKLSDKAQG